MIRRIENIGERGAQWRRRGGIVWLAIGVVALAALYLTGAPRWYRVTLAIPAGLSAIGFLQAREKTCVALCVAGKREATHDRPETTLTAEESRVLRRRSAWIVVGAMLIAAAAVGLAMLV